ncbi:lipoyl protein ligase domain-containing protein, partial [Bacillus altitudinis]|uniref:lipoyl protein ligase domain-containing protein n=1 Tax=Bacillus altitudinis TaxID=293387 RepID=UPI003B526397
MYSQYTPSPITPYIQQRTNIHILFIHNHQHYHPIINLPIQHYSLKYLHPQRTYFLFYINHPSIIIPNNQNTIQQINTKYLQHNPIKLLPTLSRPTPLYHHKPNFNFTFITKDHPHTFHNFKK